MRRQLLLTALLIAALGSTMAQAQTAAPASAPGIPLAGPPQIPAIIPDDLLDDAGPAPSFPAPPSPTVCVPRPRVIMGPCDVIHESIFGAASKDNWHPLSFSTFFSEGWDEPWVKSPEGTNGAPKQNWFGAADGVFVRLASANLFVAENMTTNLGLLLTPIPWAPAKPKTNGNDYFSTLNLYLPLNQRMELLIVAPYIASNTTKPTGHYVGNFGDLAISGRFRLVEQRNFSMQALLTERIPTGKTVNGNDINFITPGLEFWWNFAPKWVVRGGTGINIDTGRKSATDVYFNTVAVGRYLTTKDAPIFKELVAHLAVSSLTDVLGRKHHITDVYITPGLRCGLGSNQRWYALAALQVPVSGPQPYDWMPMFSLARNY